MAWGNRICKEKQGPNHAGTYRIKQKQSPQHGLNALEKQNKTNKTNKKPKTIKKKKKALTFRNIVRTGINKYLVIHNVIL